MDNVIIYKCGQKTIAIGQTNGVKFHKIDVETNIDLLVLDYQIDGFKVTVEPLGVADFSRLLADIRLNVITRNIPTWQNKNGIFKTHKKYDAEFYK